MMKRLAVLLLILELSCEFTWEVEAKKREACFFESINAPDNHLCRGGLKVIYPEVGDVSCSFIPRCYEYRARISQEWGAPNVEYSLADQNKKYVLIMVDPDSPNRADPKYRYWRHWLVTDISGKNLKSGNIKGTVLSEYRRPTPPSRTGYHRYQLFLYEQPTNQDISLSPEEKKSYGSWKVNDFVARFGLGKPVASTQFLTENYKD